MACQSTLNKARNLVIAAAATFAGAPVAVGIAIALNGGFFTAPGAPIPMAIAGGLATAAGVLLKQAFDLLQQWARDGCLSRECEGKLGNINNALTAAITTVGLLAAACFAVALVAWIPWITQPAMWAVYIPMGLAAGSLGLIANFWGPLGECQVRVASARGPLMAGEKASDPWFLRIKPKTQPSYVKSTDATLVQEDAVHSQWLDCRLYDVREWEIGAIAYILGAPSPPMTFKWTLAGQAVPISAVQSSGDTSTFTLKSPPLTATAALQVTAVDGTGFSRTIKVDVDLTSTKLSCHLVLHFVPPMYEVPTGPPGPVEITPEMDRLLESIRTAMETNTRL